MNENKQIIDDGKFVAFAYTLKDADTGDILFEAKPSAPDVMVYGVSQEVIPGLVATIKGLAKGDRFSVTLPPAVAFGDHLDEYVQQVPVEAFMRDGNMAVEVKEGSILDMMTNTGDIISGRVINVSPEFVEMDFNHPFAGKTVDFDGEIIEVRDATDEELHPKHACGCGCSHHDGCGDSCGCGNSCSC